MQEEIAKTTLDTLNSNVNLYPSRLPDKEERSEPVPTISEIKLVSGREDSLMLPERSTSSIPIEGLTNQLPTDDVMDAISKHYAAYMQKNYVPCPCKACGVLLLPFMISTVFLSNATILQRQALEEKHIAYLRRFRDDTSSSEVVNNLEMVRVNMHALEIKEVHYVQNPPPK
jgi:hypothetical protein